MPIYLIDKIKQKNNGTFKLVDDYDIEWHSDNTNKIPKDALPSNIATTDDVDSAVKKAVSEAPHMKRQILTSETLPDVSSADNLTIYMLPDSSETNNSYTEYVAVNGKWEKLGGSSVDLSNYYNKSEVDTKVNAVSTSALDASNAATQALTDAKAYTDQEKAKYVPLAGGTMTGKLVLSGDPTKSTEAATKNYVDSVASGVTPAGMITASDITTGTTNGSIAVKGTNVPVKGLGDAAYTSVSNILDQVELEWHDIPTS